MSTNYSQPRRRARSFGAGLLSGNALSQEGVAEQLQANIQFRLQSLRGMLMGQGGEEGMSPMQRRQQIRNRRQELLGNIGGPLSEDDSSSPDTRDTQSRGSGRIGRTGSGPDGTVNGTVQDSTPSMSEVDKGTKARAMSRGFGD